MLINITGSSGFIAKNLSEFLLSKGVDVSFTSMRGSWEYPGNADALIHLAGKAHDTSNTADPEDYFKVNRDLTIKIFDQFLLSQTKDFIYFSSVKAVADNIDLILMEDTLSEPTTPYGRSKAEAEEYLLKQKIPEGKRLFIIRPCMIHGPGNKGNLNILYKFVEKGLPWPLASFENKRSFLSVYNLNFMILRMLENKQIKSGVYNFADDETISTNELVLLIADILGNKQKLLKIPVKVVENIAKVGDYLPLPLNSEKLKKLTENYVVSNQKIKLALEIEKLPFSTQKGLELTLKSFCM